MNQNNRSSIRWLVVGGGPCGIATVGKLVDEGFSVLWVDPAFAVGRMGAFYRQVPANTLNSDLVYGMTLCKSFHFLEDQKKRQSVGEEVMTDLSGEHCHVLGSFVAALEDATATLQSQVTCITGIVTNLHYKQDTKLWSYVVKGGDGSSKVGEVQAVVLTTGCKPKAFPDLPDVCGAADPQSLHLTTAHGISGQVVFHSLDLMVDPTHCARLSSSSGQCWAVVGNSHSAMLVIKNLVEQGVTDIVCFVRSPLKFMYTNSHGVKKFQGTGLKGPVGDWVQQHKNLHNYPVREVYYDAEKTWHEQLLAHNAKHCVIAAGFVREDDVKISVQRSDGGGLYDLTTQDLDGYDIWSGEITLPHTNGDSVVSGVQTQNHIALFGGGIAFPQFHRDDEGEEEAWIGVKRSMRQTELMVRSFLAARHPE